MSMGTSMSRIKTERQVVGAVGLDPILLIRVCGTHTPAVSAALC